MRFATSILVVAALLSLTSGVPLQACPLLKQSHKPSCCHSKSTHKCPTATLSDCPLLNKQTSLAPALDTVSVPPRIATFHAPTPQVLPATITAWSPTPHDLLIRLHVLRI